MNKNIFEKYNKQNIIKSLQIPPSITSPTDSIDSIKFVSNTPNFSTNSDDWSLATRIAIASITSQGTMGGLIIAGFVSNDKLISNVDLQLTNNFVLFIVRC